MSDEEKSADEPQVVSEPGAPVEESSAEQQKQAETEQEIKHEKKVEKKEAKKEKSKMAPRSIDVREYSKVILFYPLFFYSIISWIIVKLLPGGTSIANGTGSIIIPEEPADGILAVIWIGIFFANLFVVAFNFPTAKFFILFLVLVVVVLIVILLYLGGFIPKVNSGGILEAFLDASMNSTFYSLISWSLGIILLFCLIGARLRYVHIEENEVFIKTVMMGKEERYPTNSMKYTKEIPDVFEFLCLGAGKMTFTLGTGVVVTVNLIPRVNKIAEKIDLMGDFLQVSIGKK
ncbi:MAG TPA: hypothetical protein VKM55_06115 [Candidatus Lokiarchaeia archaeon]|nr:hypothetical protein [Candidatus Lokiarchaeia archaeon]